MKVENPVSQNLCCQTINRIQNKSFCLHNIYLCNVYIYYVYKNTHTYRAPLAQTTASVVCGMEAISLWHYWGTIEPSAHLDCWIDCFSSFSWKYPIDYIQGSGQACWLPNQAQ